MRIKSRKNKNSRIDTSIDGFKYVGINLTKQQFEDLCALNMLIMCNENRKNIPVFNTMLVLKTLGLLPPEMINEIGDKQRNGDFNDGSEESFQRKFGKIKE